MNEDAENKTMASTADARLIIAVLMVLSACVVAFAFRTRACFVDDAFIGFQYLRHLLAGEGWVYFPGEAPVEGVTNIGWLLALAPWCRWSEPTTVAKLAGLALVLWSLILTLHVGRGLAAKTARPEDAFGLVLPPVLMLATSFPFVYFSLAGMETGLLASLLLGMASAAMRRPDSMLLPVLGAAAFLVHPESAVVYPLFAALRWRRASTGRRRAAVAGLLIFTALLGMITGARLAYFHDLVPNTFHAKPGGWQAAMQNGYDFLMGRNPNVAFPVTGWLALPVLLLGYRRLVRAAPPAADMLAAICAAGLLFAVYSPPDWSEQPRYFAPYLPAALMMLWAGVNEAIPLLLGVGAGQRLRQSIAAVTTLLLVLANVVDGRNQLARQGEFPGYVLAGQTLAPPARWLAERLPPEATIATRRIGAVAYYSNRRVFDYAYGLTERDVARAVRRHGGRFDFPGDSALADLWRARRPDYLLEDDAVMNMIVARAGGDPRHFTIHGDAYRVVDWFPIGRATRWMLAGRIGKPSPPAPLPTEEGSSL